jgi:hypothetical protein
MHNYSPSGALARAALSIINLRMRISSGECCWRFLQFDCMLNVESYFHVHQLSKNIIIIISIPFLFLTNIGVKLAIVSFKMKLFLRRNEVTPLKDFLKWAKN